MFSKFSPSSFGSHSASLASRAAHPTALGMAVAGLAIMGLTAGAASASTITVLNPNFSSPVTATYSFGPTSSPSGSPVTDWGVNGYAGVVNKSSISGDASQLIGSQIGVADTASDNTTLSGQPDNSDLYQDVGALLPNTVYSLTVYTGFNSGYASGEFGVLQLVNGTSDTGTVLNGTTYDSSALTSFGNVTLDYTTGSTVSGDLTLVLGAAAPTGGDQVGFNNVRLTANPVPEPASLGLFAVGGLGLLLLNRRKTA